MFKKFKTQLRGIIPGFLRRSAHWGVGSRSSEYWEERYRLGGHSGAGSRGRLARFKADTVNRLVRDLSIQSVLELGSGDGQQLTDFQIPQYLGVDVSKTAICRCLSQGHDKHNRQFLCLDMDHPPEWFLQTRFDAGLSLDVLFHLVEDRSFQSYMETLTTVSLRYLIIYSSNWEHPQKAHERHRCFQKWIEKNAPDWQLWQHIPNPYPYRAADPQHTSHSDFYIFQRKSSSAL